MELKAQWPDSSPAAARANLRFAVRELSARGLTPAAKWASELLVCVPPSPAYPQSPLRSSLQASAPSYDVHSTPASRAGPSSTALRSKWHPTHSTPALSLPASGSRSASPNASVSANDESGRFASLKYPPSPLANVSYDAASTAEGDEEGEEEDASAHVHFAPSVDVSSALGSGSEHHYQQHFGLAPEPEHEEDVYALAKSLFDSKQLERCVSVLRRHKASGPRSTFLRLHTSLLISERELDEDVAILSKSQGKLPASSETLLEVLAEVIDPKDPFLLFIKGRVLRKLKKRLEAMDSIVRSLIAFPYNWSAWLELAGLLDHENNELDDIAELLPDSFMTCFFLEHYGRDSSRTRDESMERCAILLRLFPDCPYLLVCKALNLYFSKDNEAALAAFEEARAIDPLILEGIAEYSNILHVTDESDKLANLTHTLAEAGRDNPEVCCAIGNYHSLQGDHARAAECFKRALRLNLGCVPAWILLGHSFVEMKNPHAAAEMYRRAIDINPRDVRPWTGLGLVYELHEAWSYALYYFQKACASDPYDPRFWESMANCHQKLGNLEQAMGCYKRQLSIGLGLADQLKAMEAMIRLCEMGSGSGRGSTAPGRARRGVAIEKEERAEEDEDEDEEAVAQAQVTLQTAAWHRRIVQLLERNRDGAETQSVARYVGSYLLAARWEMGMLGGGAERLRRLGREGDKDDAIGEGNAAAMDLDGAGKCQGAGASPPGNVALAYEYLSRVVAAGTERTAEAESLLKQLSLLRT